MRHFTKNYTEGTQQLLFFSVMAYVAHCIYKTPPSYYLYLGAYYNSSQKIMTLPISVYPLYVNYSCIKTFILLTAMVGKHSGPLKRIFNLFIIG